MSAISATSYQCFAAHCRRFSASASRITKSRANAAQPVLGVALGGYLFFNAASWWAKMPPKRRGEAVRPMLTYAAVAGLFTIALLLSAGWGALAWVAVLAVQLRVAYVLTLRAAGRSLGSGLVTAVASSALLLVAVQPDLPAFFRDPRGTWLWAAAIMYGCTAGAVFAVKSMIRERDSDRFLGASASSSLASPLSSWPC